jgi:hypothetical protein
MQWGNVGTELQVMAPEIRLILNVKIDNFSQYSWIDDVIANIKYSHVLSMPISLEYHLHISLCFLLLRKFILNNAINL